MPSTDPIHSPNRTRDHLANERTFLAWVRTALGLIGLGFVLARMGLFLSQLALADVPGMRHVGSRGVHEFLWTGVVFLILGTTLCGAAAWLYDRARIAIDSDRYEPARNAVMLMTALIIAGGLTIVILVIWQLTWNEGH